MLLNGFNEACNNIAASYLKVEDYSMDTISFWTTAKGGLSHFSYIFCNKETLGIELNNTACSVTGALLFIEIYICKVGKDISNHHLELRKMLACTKRIMESTKGLGQRDVEESSKDCFIFDS